MATALFVCLHNAGRSQMAAALFDRAADGRHQSLSAGTTPADRLHPEVVAVMNELGVDLSTKQPAKLTDDLAHRADVVVTMGCGDQCPFIPGKRYIDWKLADPKGRPLDEVRATRDDIAARVAALLLDLDALPPTTAVTLTPGSAADLEALGPIWCSVHHRHAEAMPELGPYVDDATTWAVRSKLYTELLAKPDTVLVLGHDDDGALVAYGMAHVMAVEETWLEDTWRTGERIGEIETVAVLPGHRDQGTGSRILDHLEQRLAEQGVHDLILGTLAGNDAAIRLYERRGYRPTWNYLTRLRRP